MGAKYTAGGETPAVPSRDAEIRADGASPDGAVDVIEVVGTTKWFDVGKGFGFIIPDDGRPDVLLHVTCLRRDGYQTAYEGARVVCEALARPVTGPEVLVVGVDRDGRRDLAEQLARCAVPQ